MGLSVGRLVFMWDWFVWFNLPVLWRVGWCVCVGACGVVFFVCRMG